MVLLGGCSFTRDYTGDYVLENGDVRVTLMQDKPGVSAYLHKPTGGTLLGDVRGTGPEILVFKGVEAVALDTADVTYQVRQSPAAQGVVYHTTVTQAGEVAVEFDLHYRLGGDGLTVELDKVVEHGDYYLIHVVMPGLVTVRADEGVAKLAISADSGRLIDVAKASEKVYEYEIDWLNAILEAMVYNGEVLGLVDTESLEDHGIVEVFEAGGVKYGSLSMKLMHRLKEYDLEEFGPIVPVVDPAYLLRVQEGTSVVVTVVGDHDGDGEVSWVDGAKVLRERIDATPNPYYADKAFVRAFVDRPPTQRDPTGTREELPFDEVLDRIKEFAAQTDSAAYVLYLLGWQYTGHDSGYPAVDVVNENLGGYDGLVRLIEEARKYNVTVTFHDNYDDAYQDSPAWDPDIICRDAQGNLMIGGVWEERPSYLICAHQYAQKSGLDRVNATLDRYPVKDAYFIDVMAGGYNGGRKYNFDPENPAGAVKNFEGKLAIVREFNKRGIDVATEDFTGFWVGHVGSFGNIIAFDNVYFENEESIPLIPFIYHGKTSYGMKISDNSQNLKRFLYGQRGESFTNRRSVFDPHEYILDALPKIKLYGKEMKSYEKEGDLERVVYDDGTIVEVNVPADTYRVVLSDGRVIAENYTSFVPEKENVYFACSRDGGVLRYALDPGWADSSRIRVLKMKADGTRDEVAFTVAGGNIEFTAEPETPYKVVYLGQPS